MQLQMSANRIMICMISFECKLVIIEVLEEGIILSGITVRESHITVF